MPRAGWYSTRRIGCSTWALRRISAQSCGRCAAINLQTSCSHHAIRMPSVCNRVADALQSICKYHAIIMPSVCHQCTIVWQVRCNQSANIMQISCHQYAISVAGVCNQSANTMPSVCNQYAISVAGALQSICKHHAISMQSVWLVRSNSAIRTLQSGDDGSWCGRVRVDRRWSMHVARQRRATTPCRPPD